MHLEDICVSLSESQIKNPRYSSFRWVRVLASQTKLIRDFLDTRVLLQEDCKDTLEIKDSGQTIFSTCRQNHPPSEVISATESVEVSNFFRYFQYLILAKKT